MKGLLALNHVAWYGVVPNNNKPHSQPPRNMSQSISLDYTTFRYRLLKKGRE